MRFDHLQGERGCDGRVEGVAAAFEHAHGQGGCKPMCGGDNAEQALDFRPRGKGKGREHNDRLKWRDGAPFTTSPTTASQAIARRKSTCLGRARAERVRKAYGRVARNEPSGRATHWPSRSANPCAARRRR